MSVHSINHVQLGFRAGDQSVIRHFYGQVLGLNEFRSTGASTLRFHAGPQRIDLVPTEHWQPPPAVHHLAFEVDNLPGLRAKLLDAGLALDESRPLPGYLRFYVRDPAGNPLEFVEPDPSGAGTV